MTIFCFFIYTLILPLPPYAFCCFAPGSVFLITKKYTSITVRSSVLYCSLLINNQ